MFWIGTFSKVACGTKGIIPLVGDSVFFMEEKKTGYRRRRVSGKSRSETSELRCSIYLASLVRMAHVGLAAPHTPHGRLLASRSGVHWPVHLKILSLVVIVSDRMQKCHRRILLKIDDMQRRESHQKLRFSSILNESSRCGRRTPYRGDGT